MRFTPALVGLATIAFASTAAAEQISVAPVTYSADFQNALTRELGEREGVYLSADVTRAVSDALARRGATLGSGGLTVETTIVDADPNRVTMHQLAVRPTIDAGATVSVGGAELHAVIKDASGRTLTEVNHRRYDYTLADLVGPPTTWTTADRVIGQFAEKVADAYVAQAHAQ